MGSHPGPATALNEAALEGNEISNALANWSATLVGVLHIEELEELLRKSMLREALERTGGNFTQTATLLGLHRQGVQQLVVRFGMQATASELRRRASVTRAAGSSDARDAKASDADANLPRARPALDNRRALQPMLAEMFSNSKHFDVDLLRRRAQCGGEVQLVAPAAG